MNKNIDGYAKMEEMKNKVGKGTTLVSLLISKGSNIWLVQKNLTKEYSLSNSVKSKETRKGVQDAIRSIQNRLKEMKKIPETGVGIYSGWCF